MNKMRVQALDLDGNLFNEACPGEAAVRLNL